MSCEHCANTICDSCYEKNYAIQEAWLKSIVPKGATIKRLDIFISEKTLPFIKYLFQEECAVWYEKTDYDPMSNNCIKKDTDM